MVAACILTIPVVENAWSRHQVSLAAQQAQTKLQTKSAENKLQGTPTRVLIPSLAIDLPVVSQLYSPITKTWPVANSTANYAVETVLINNTHGESLIYGHSTRAIFGPLLNLKPDAQVYIYTNNGHIFKYVYTGSQDVSPRQTQIIADMAKAPAGLKMITCDGPYFQYRHLMTFRLINSV